LRRVPRLFLYVRRVNDSEAAASQDGGERHLIAGAGPAVLLAASVALIAIAPAVVPDGYSVIEHTTSESAAQLVAGSRAARTGFVCLGLAVLWLARARSRDRGWGPAGTIAHLLFGICMLGTAVFAARSWETSAPYDTTEDLLHSVAYLWYGTESLSGPYCCGSTDVLQVDTRTSRSTDRRTDRA